MFARALTPAIQGLQHSPGVCQKPRRLQHGDLLLWIARHLRRHVKSTHVRDHLEHTRVLHELLHFVKLPRRGGGMMLVQEVPSRGYLFPVQLETESQLTNRLIQLFMESRAALGRKIFPHQQVHED